MSITNELVKGVVESRIFDDLGVTVEIVDAKDLDLSWVDLGNHKLSPKTCGPVAPIFSSLSVTIRAGWDKGDALHIEYKYLYEKSSGGSNGSTVYVQINESELK